MIKLIHNLFGNNTKISANDIVHQKNNGKFQTLETILNQKSKILWEGVFYLNENQPVNLKEKISEQTHGVVLIWSGYDLETGQEKNYNYRITFIPKCTVGLIYGTFEIFGGTQGISAFKYFYVSDSQITGNNVNQQIVGGLDNRTIVLRYVIGF